MPPLEVVALQGTIELRAAALLALAEIAPARTEAFVVERAKSDPSGEVREAGTRALGFASGPLSLAHLRATDEDRAARIALHRRAATSSKAELEAVVAAALANGAEDDRVASVCLEVLADRREASPTLVLEVVRGRPALVSARAAAGLGVLGSRHQELLLDAIVAKGALPEADAGREWHADNAIAHAFGRLVRHVDPARVFERLAPIVAGAKGVLAASIVQTLSEQAVEAWTDEARGFDDDDPPVAPPPDVRWRPIVASYVAPEVLDFDVDVTSLRECLAWSASRAAFVTPPFRIIESGAEEGAAFVVAGFDVDALRDTAALVHALEGFGTRAATNLHLFTHQCDGYACLPARILGVPLATKAFRDDLGPASDAVERLYQALHASRPPSAVALADVRAILLPWIPRLPPLVAGVEALVSTASVPIRPALEGLPVVRILPASAPWRAETGFWTFPVDAMRERGPFGEREERLLEAVGRHLGLGAPKVFVLWANSD